MGKELSEMTLEELWDLFPVFLVQHDDHWNEYYIEIESTITDLLAGYPVNRISHIGSTAIQGIWAKNIVDVMVEISEIEEAYQEKVKHKIGNVQIYRVLRRHGWRKIMPRSKHPKKASEEAIEASKKLSNL